MEGLELALEKVLRASQRVPPEERSPEMLHLAEGLRGLQLAESELRQAAAQVERDQAGGAGTKRARRPTRCCSRLALQRVAGEGCKQGALWAAGQRGSGGGRWSSAHLRALLLCWRAGAGAPAASHGAQFRVRHQGMQQVSDAAAGQLQPQGRLAICSWEACPTWLHIYMKPLRQLFPGLDG